LGDDIVTAIQQTVLENVTPLIEENFDLKQQLMFSAKENSATNMKNGKVKSIKRNIFSDSDKTHGTDDHCDSTGNSKEHKPPFCNDQDQLKFDKQALEVELLEFQKICQFRVMDMTENEDLNFIFGEGTFDQIAIVETLAVGKWSKYNKCKKTVSYKFKTALQMVLALDDIKSQRTTTAFSTLFGLLLISYGAGKVVRQTLEPFGLCKSYDF
jgi:hypothetical protein